MTKQEHIDFWASQVESDLDCSSVLLRAGHLAQAMFWGHLCLEKILKALWIKNHESNTPPFVHNLLKLAKDSGVELTDEQLAFFSDMNTFQARGRYPEYPELLEATLTQELCEEYFTQIQQSVEWIRQHLH